MSKPFLYVSTVIRGSTNREMTGFFYKVDWRSKQVVAKVPVPPFVGALGARGGSRGGRGLALFEGRLFASTFDKILVYDHDYRLERSITHPLVMGHHEIHADATGIWCCSTLIDAFIKLAYDGTMIDGCFVSEEPAMIADGYRSVPRDRQYNYLAEAENDVDTSAKYQEQFHLNTVTVGADSGEVHGFSNNTGHLLRIRPRFEILARMPHLRGSHNVQLASGELFVNHTYARAFQIYAPGEFETPRVHLTLDEGVHPSEQFATSGWIRGMCWIDRDLIVVGTSPAGLISIDLNTMRVAERFDLERDVSHAVHGLANAER